MPDARAGAGSWRLRQIDGCANDTKAEGGRRVVRVRLQPDPITMFKDLNDFIDALDKTRELARIGEPVSPDLEICAVTDRVSKSPGGGPALLFERPAGFDMPVAVNLFGSLKRTCLALGVDTLDDLAGEIEELTTPKIPGGLLDAVKMLPMVNRLRDLMPKTVSDAPLSGGRAQGRVARRLSDPQVLA